MLTRLFGVMGRVDEVPLRNVGVVPGLLVVAGLVMLGRHAVVLGGVLVMFGGFTVMLSGLLGHAPQA